MISLRGTGLYTTSYSPQRVSTWSRAIAEKEKILVELVRKIFVVLTTT